MHTQSDRPLATDFGQSIAQTLVGLSYKARQLIVSPRSAVSDIFTAAKAMEKDGKIFHFLLQEWSTDTWFTTTLSYCLQLNVLDFDGNVRGITSQCGKDDVSDEKPILVFNKLINAPQTQSAYDESTCL